MNPRRETRERPAGRTAFPVRSTLRGTGVRARPSTTPKGRKVDAKPVAERFEWDAYFGKAIKSRLDAHAYSNVQGARNAVETPYANQFLDSDNVVRLAGGSFFLMVPNWNIMTAYSMDLHEIWKRNQASAWHWLLTSWSPNGDEDRDLSLPPDSGAHVP